MQWQGNTLRAGHPMAGSVVACFDCGTRETLQRLRIFKWCIIKSDLNNLHLPQLKSTDCDEMEIVDSASSEVRCF